MAYEGHDEGSDISFGGCLGLIVFLLVGALLYSIVTSALGCEIIDPDDDRYPQEEWIY